jgi:hypothetical protein
MAKLSDLDIATVLQRAVEIGQKRIKSANAPNYSDSTASEKFLVALIKDAMKEHGFDESLVIHHGGHAFPDVTIETTTIGIELKGTTSHHKFNGNSVVASTMRPSLTKIYLLYWIGQEKEIGLRDYFDCVAYPVVTHSPRFQLDIDLKRGESMFGTQKGKVGNVEDVIFRRSGGIDSDKIISWMAERARAKNETPWWISQDETLPTGSTGLKKCAELDQREREAFLKNAFLLFPQVFDRTSRNKYNDVVAWAISTHGVLTTRDDYSAGGKVPITISAYSSQTFDLPAVVERAINALNSPAKVYLDEVNEALGRRFSTCDEFLSFYKSRLKSTTAHMYSAIEAIDTKKFGAKKFSEALSELLVQAIDKRTII